MDKLFSTQSRSPEFLYFICRIRNVVYFRPNNVERDSLPESEI